VPRLDRTSASHHSRSPRSFIASDQVITASDQANIASDQVVTASDQANIASDQLNIASDQLITASDQLNIASDQLITASDQPNIASDQVITGSNQVNRGGHHAKRRLGRRTPERVNLNPLYRMAVVITTTNFRERNSHQLSDQLIVEHVLAAVK
jgi:hypothetical protein